ncbi:A1pp-domain-containing protein [Cyathus striatus]|nr:A1pp-domain-containing protein [Cyathus striatus]
MSATSSPRSSTSSESELDDMIHLKDIKTIGQLYKESVLKAIANTDQTRYKPSAGLLNRISLFQGDITKLSVDAIVNAANKSLLGASHPTSIDGAIHAAAGPKLLDECRGLNGCETGQSKITKGYNLPAKHIIHTVGPVYSSSDVEEKARLLASCYKTSLEVAIENSLRHIAFPSISTGIYGYPIRDATRIALNEVRELCNAESGEKLERIIFVVWSNKDKGVYEELIPEYFPLVSDADV